MKPIKAWMIVGYADRSVTIDERMAVYWLRKPAQEELKGWTGRCRLIRVEIREIKSKQARQKGTP